MIEKNNNIEDIENDEFSRLLDDFLKSEIASVETEPEDDVEEPLPIPQIEYVPYKDVFVTYMIPKPTDDEAFFREAVFSLGSKLFLHNNDNEHEVFIHPTDTCSEHSLLLKDICTVGVNDEIPHTAFLYRVGVSNPIAIETTTQRYGDIKFEFKQAGDLPVGHYFILLNSLSPSKDCKSFGLMAHCVRYSFAIKRKGDYLCIPEVSDFQIKQSGRKNVLYSSDCLKISFTCSAFSEEDDTLRLTCFDGAYCKMGEAVAFTKKRKGRYSVLMDARSIWMPGEYTLYIALNTYPGVSVKFTLDEDDFKVDNPKQIESHSDSYNLLKYLEAGNQYWDRLRNKPGVEMLKRRVIADYPNRLLNEKRENMKLNNLYSNRNFLIVMQGNEMNHSVIGDFRRAMCDDGDFCEEDCLLLAESNPNSPLENNEAIVSVFSTSYEKTVCLTHIDGLFAGKGNIVVQNMMNFLRRRNEHNVVLCGTRAEIDSVMDAFPALKKFFPCENVLEMKSFTAAEVVRLFQTKLLEQHLEFSCEAERIFAQTIASLHVKGVFTKWGEENVMEFIENHIVPNVRRRLIQQMYRYDTAFQLVETEDIDFDALADTSASFDDSMQELNDMVGLSTLKNQLMATFNRTRFDAIRREMGLKAAEEGCHHMIFTGNPGTGKTTVAKMVGRIYHSLGLLSKGDVIYTERSRMVGRYIGETEQNMRAILQQAKGNVLFVDEAYTLCDTDEDRKDFGYHALESLLTVLSQKNPDMIVIFAGYEKEIERMLNANQGLKGRFPHHFKFEDYTADELMQIARQIIGKEEYELDGEAEKRLLETIEDSVSHKDEEFSNARWLGYYVDAIITAVGDRLLSSEEKLSRSVCCTITSADVNTAYEKFRFRASAASGSRVTSISALPRVGFRIA